MQEFVDSRCSGVTKALAVTTFSTTIWWDSLSVIPMTDNHKTETIIFCQQQRNLNSNMNQNKIFCNITSSVSFSSFKNAKNFPIEKNNNNNLDYVSQSHYLENLLISNEIMNCRNLLQYLQHSDDLYKEWTDGGIEVQWADFQLVNGVSTSNHAACWSGYIRLLKQYY